MYRDRIYKIIWQSKNLKNLEEIYQFEVRFNIPEDCTDFAYSVHGKYENGSTKLSLLSPEDTKKITKGIFKKAQSLIEELNKEIQLAESDENSTTPIAVNSDLTQS